MRRGGGKKKKGKGAKRGTDYSIRSVHDRAADATGSVARKAQLLPLANKAERRGIIACIAHVEINSSDYTAGHVDGLTLVAARKWAADPCT